SSSSGLLSVTAVSTITRPPGPETAHALTGSHWPRKKMSARCRIRTSSSPRTLAPQTLAVAVDEKEAPIRGDPARSQLDVFGAQEREALDRRAREEGDRAHDGSFLDFSHGRDGDGAQAADRRRVGRDRRMARRAISLLRTRRRPGGEGGSRRGGARGGRGRARHGRLPAGAPARGGPRPRRRPAEGAARRGRGDDLRRGGETDEGRPTGSGPGRGPRQ